MFHRLKAGLIRTYDRLSPLSKLRKQGSPQKLNYPAASERGVKAEIWAEKYAKYAKKTNKFVRFPFYHSRTLHFFGLFFLFMTLHTILQQTVGN